MIDIRFWDFQSHAKNGDSVPIRKSNSETWQLTKYANNLAIDGIDGCTLDLSLDLFQLLSVCGFGI